MQCNKHRRRLPDTPPPRVRRDTKQDCKAGNGSEPDAEFAEVARSAPDHAECLVPLVASVGLALWEETTFMVDVLIRAVVHIRELDDASLADAVEPILDNDLAVDDVRPRRDKPGARRVST